MRFSVRLILAFISVFLLKGDPSAAVRTLVPEGAPAMAAKVAVHAEIRSLMSQGRFQVAADLAQHAGRHAEQAGRIRSAAFFHYHASRAFASAGLWGRSMASASASRALALRMGDLRTAAFASQALAAAFFVSENFELAEAEAGRMRQYMGPDAASGSAYLLQSAIASKRGNSVQALGYSRRAVDLAAAKGDLEETALAFNELGLRLLKAGRTRSASDFLIEAFRLRKLGQSPYLGQSYYNLGRLLLEQNQPRLALRMFEASASHASVETVPMPWVRFRIATAYRAMGDRAEALRQARIAAHLARQMRIAYPFGNELQVRAEERIQDIYDLLVELAWEEHERTGSPEALAEAFSAALENRATSLILRSLSAGQWQSRLPADYFQNLAVLRKLEAEALLPGKNVNGELVKLRADLAAAESSAGLDVAAAGATPQTRMARLSGSLAPGEPLLAFHLSDRRSYCFMLRDGRLAARALAPRDELTRRIEQFRALVEQNSVDAAKLGAPLFRALFGDLLDGIRAPVITLVPDEVMYTLPFAALVTSAAGESPQYLVQRHALRLAPSAFFFRSGMPSSQPMTFAGVADPVFNRADSRWPGRGFWFQLTARWGMKDAVEMARLVATGGEVERSAAFWPESRILRGSEVSVAGVSSMLRTSPRILHVATHMLRRDGDSSPAIVLGLDESAGLKLWTASDIAAVGHAPQYVALSGCGSGSGPVLRGAGLLGLTRAWLTAGTHAVVASYWPTPEESDWLFVEYYRYLRGGSDPSASRRAAIALQQAQLDAIRLGQWRGRIWYWGAYFVIGAL